MAGRWAAPFGGRGYGRAIGIGLAGLIAGVAGEDERRAGEGDFLTVLRDQLAHESPGRDVFMGQDLIKRRRPERGDIAGLQRLCNFLAGVVPSSSWS